MIKSERQYRKAMRNMILKVQAGKQPDQNGTAEEMEVLAECINNGYILGSITHFSHDLNRMIDSRTLDGVIHPQITNNIIPLKGLAFLKPDRTALKANLALVISILAITIAFLAQADSIVENFRWLIFG